MKFKLLIFILILNCSGNGEFGYLRFKSISYDNDENEFFVKKIDRTICNYTIGNGSYQYKLVEFKRIYHSHDAIKNFNVSRTTEFFFPLCNFQGCLSKVCYQYSGEFVKYKKDDLN